MGLPRVGRRPGGREGGREGERERGVRTREERMREGEKEGGRERGRGRTDVLGVGIGRDEELLPLLVLEGVAHAHGFSGGSRLVEEGGVGHGHAWGEGGREGGKEGEYVGRRIRDRARKEEWDIVGHRIKIDTSL